MKISFDSAELDISIEVSSLLRRQGCTDEQVWHLTMDIQHCLDVRMMKIHALHIHDNEKRKVT
jgi:hypothetical protein